MTGSSPTQIVRGPLLNPTEDGRVEYLPDAALVADGAGRLLFVGLWEELSPLLGSSELPVTHATGVITPSFLDCHTHIPQYPIRGRFTEGLPDDLREGRLLAGLERNVFPEEARDGNTDYAASVVQDFAAATRAQGVIGGAAYMTVHPDAARAALCGLAETWSVGLVLMNQNCHSFLRTDEETLEQDVARLAAEYGPRLIVTDRFAVTGSTSLRRRAVAMAARWGLRMQTHLNEQRAEKALVEHVLYPHCRSYTHVYQEDGLLTHRPILAHCIQMRSEEWKLLQAHEVAVAHCPTSNTLLGSGTMSLDDVMAHGLPYALCSDVGASPTQSLLAEMAQFLKVHAGRSTHATPSEALWRVTLAPARILGLDRDLGSFAVGKKLSYRDIAADLDQTTALTADDVIFTHLLDSPSAAGLEADFDLLAAEGIEHGEALMRLTEDVHATVRQLEMKVQR